MDIATSYGERFKTYPGIIAKATGGRAIQWCSTSSASITRGIRRNAPIHERGSRLYASVLRNLAYAGMTVALNWSFKEAPYGLIDMDDHPRPVAEVYRWERTS